MEKQIAIFICNICLVCNNFSVLICLKYLKLHFELFKLPLSKVSLQVISLVLLSESIYHLLILELTLIQLFLIVSRLFYILFSYALFLGISLTHLLCFIFFCSC